LCFWREEKLKVQRSSSDKLLSKEQWEFRCIRIVLSGGLEESDEAFLVTLLMVCSSLKRNLIDIAPLVYEATVNEIPT